MVAPVWVPETARASDVKVAAGKAEGSVIVPVYWPPVPVNVKEP